MKRSITYRIKFYMIIALLFVSAIAIGKKFLMPATEAAQAYFENKSLLEDLSRIDPNSRNIDLLIRSKKEQIDLTSESEDQLQTELLNGIEETLDNYTVIIDEVGFTKTTRFGEYQLFHTQVRFSGKFPDLLKASNHIEKSIEHHRLTSTRYYIDKSKKKLYAEIIIQAVTDL